MQRDVVAVAAAAPSAADGHALLIASKGERRERGVSPHLLDLVPVGRDRADFERDAAVSEYVALQTTGGTRREPQARQP
jgi:hypothetical protein